MACEWPSFTMPDAAFHNHEWARHGTCAAAVLGGDRQHFFDTVLHLNQQYDLNVSQDLCVTGHDLDVGEVRLNQQSDLSAESGPV